MQTTHKIINGHVFNRLTDVCENCRMSLGNFKGAGEPRCPGKKPVSRHTERTPIDPTDGDAA
jgi:hypothetical protein